MALLCAATGARACPPAGDDVTFSQSIEYGETKASADPTIAAQVDGHDAKWILDTGTYPTVLLRAFYRDVMGTAPEAAEPATATLTIARERYRIRPLQIIDPGEGVFARDIGGLISPQAISADQIMVMDLNADCFIAVAGPADRALGTLARLYPSLRFAPVRWMGSKDGVLFVEGSYENGKPVTLDVDTGRRNSAFDAEYLGSVPSQVAGERRNTAGVRTAVRKTLGGVVRMQGAFARSLPVDIRGAQKSARITWKGSLGMDFLKGLVIAIPPKGSPVIYVASAEARP